MDAPRSRTTRLITPGRSWPTTLPGCSTIWTSLMPTTSVTPWVRGSGWKPSSPIPTASAGRYSEASDARGSVTDAVVEMFYQFAAARPINDLEALACCILGPQPRLSPDRLASIRVPVAIMAGDLDPIAQGAHELARQIPGARFVAISGRNHMNAVPARQFKEAALDFLAQGSGV